MELRASHRVETEPDYVSPLLAELLGHLRMWDLQFPDILQEHDARIEPGYDYPEMFDGYSLWGVKTAPSDIPTHDPWTPRGHVDRTAEGIPDRERAPYREQSLRARGPALLPCTHTDACTDSESLCTDVHTVRSRQADCPRSGCTLGQLQHRSSKPANGTATTTTPGRDFQHRNVRFTFAVEFWFPEPQQLCLPHRPNYSQPGGPISPLKHGDWHTAHSHLHATSHTPFKGGSCRTLAD